MNRLGFTDGEAALLSFGEYYELYNAYQKMFDMETILRVTGKTYNGLLEEENNAERPIEW